MASDSDRGAGQRGRDWLREDRVSPAFELTALVDDDQIGACVLLRNCWTFPTTMLRRSG